MLYQGFKYFIVRIGVSCLLMLTLGYAVLFFVHEIAMPVSRVDDRILQWVLLAVCIFFGFVVFGMFGEYRFARGLRLLRESELKEQTSSLFRQFQSLIRFTYSSYFRPQVGKRLRHRVFREYAEHLLILGAEDSEAQSIYARAYLLDPDNQKFKDILVSTLTRKERLSHQEVDLLLIILKANHYEDRELINFLVDWFLERDLFTVKTEPVFHKALELKTGKEHRITRFLVPVLLAEKRVDPNSAEFFLFALPEAGPDQRKQLVRVLGMFFCEKRFQVIRPELHDECRKVFETLDSQVQVQLTEEAERKTLEKMEAYPPVYFRRPGSFERHACPCRVDPVDRKSPGAGRLVGTAIYWQDFQSACEPCVERARLVWAATFAIETDYVQWCIPDLSHDGEFMGLES